MKMADNIRLTGIERFIEGDEIIVTKTDLKGKLTYANDVFRRISHVSEAECLGQPHSLIRHPDMPRCIFQMLWDHLQNGQEIFAYVVNRALNGDHYWVHAHVTPSFDESGQIIGYHSNRRLANKETLTNTIIPLYKKLLQEEQRHANRKDGMKASLQMIQDMLSEQGVEYDEFICNLSNQSMTAPTYEPVAKTANG